MIREYKTIREISGPLMVVDHVQGVTYDELAEIELTDGTTRRCKVLEVNGDTAVVQLFEASAGINLAESKIRFLGHPLQLAVSGDMLGRVFSGMGDPIDALFWSDYWFSLWLPELLQYLALAAAGGAMLGAGVSMDRRLKRYAKYLAVMGDREAMPVEELARTLKRLGPLDDASREALETMANALVRKLNHDPIMFLKGDGMAREGAAARISTVRRIFNLDKNVCTCSGKN